MNAARSIVYGAIAGAGLSLAACSGSPAPPAQQTSDPTQTPTPAATRASAQPSTAATKAHQTNAGAVAFAPPPESAIPDNQFGAMVRKGERIFTHTQEYAGQYVGDDLNCSSCHLDAGRRANSAPLWAAWVRYPRYRSKNHRVNTFAERLQGCFRFSMNGKAPPIDGEIIKALATYSYWLATNAPTGKNLPGYGFVDLPNPAQPPDYQRGKHVFEKNCALCHGADGHGQQAEGVTVFPPLWGPHSFNWGAGMSSVNSAARFIKDNMPFSRGGTLSDQEAWDVAYYLDAHERPQDPRFAGNVAATRKQYHDSKWSLYGTKINGHLLGNEPLKAHN